MSPQDVSLALSPEIWSNLLSLALGFALAGALTNGYQAALARPASFALLSQHERAKAMLSIPFVVFAAPFLIMRNILAEKTSHRGRTLFVMMATVIAGFWSLMSGTVVVAMLHATGLLA